MGKSKSALRSAFKGKKSKSRSVWRENKSRLRVEALERRELLTTFFVDGPGGSGAGGNDNNDGLTTATAFATIQQAADVAQPGDLVLIRGGTYREQVTLPRSGTPDNRIVFRANGTENVRITTTDVLTGFTQTPETNDNGNVYVATLEGSTTNSLLNRHELTVFVNGELVQEATNNNSADYLVSDTWSKVDSVTGNGATITDTDLRNFSDLTGGFIRVRTSNFTLAERRITAHNASTGTITLDSPVGNVTGRDYLVHDARSLVDSPGEWYFNEESNQFFLWAPGGGDPDNFTVEVKRRAEVFDTNGHDNLVFADLTLVGGDFFTSASSPFFGNQSDNLLIDNVHVIAPDRIFGPDFGTTRTGIVLNGNNNVIRDSEFEQIWSAAIRLGGDDNRIINNFIHDAAFNGGGSGGIATVDSASRNLISNNTFTRHGRSAIVGGGDRNIIQSNDFSRTALITEDTGAIYSFNTSYGNTIIRNNVFRLIGGVENSGIYVDNFSSDLIVHNNIFYDVQPLGGKINLPTSHILYYNNTIVDSGRFDTNGPADTRNLYGNRLINNLYAVSLDPDLTNGLDDATDVRNNRQSSNSDFVNAGARDYRLNSNSPAVNAGRVIPGITDGFAGSAPDLGAIELGSAPFGFAHNFNANPNPAYNFPALPFGANRVDNASFERNLDDFSTTGSPQIISQIGSDFRVNGLVRFGNRSVALDGGEAIRQTVTDLQPNTTYRFGAWAKPIRQIVQAESFNPNGTTQETLGSVRGVTTVSGLGNNDVLRYDNINFTGRDQLTLQIAQSNPNSTVELRLGSATGTLVGTINPPSNTTLIQSSVPFDVSGVTGTQDVFLVFRGSGNLGQLDSFRLANSADQVEISVSDFGGGTVSREIGNRLFTGSNPTLTFTTGPNATSAEITVRNPGSGYTGYVDYLSVSEAENNGSNQRVTVNTSRTEYFYDLGTGNSPLFDANSDPYERISPQTFGDISFSTVLDSIDREATGQIPGPTFNDINRDVIQVYSPTTFNHRLANGTYRVLVTAGDAVDDTASFVLTGDSGVSLTTNSVNSGSVSNFTLNDIVVTDGELNLDIDPQGGVANLTRIIVTRTGEVPSQADVVTVDLSRTQYNYDIGTPDSPIFTGLTDGIAYERISPNTTGDIFWNAPVDSIDRGTSSGANDINRDFVFAFNPRTLSHRVADGRWEVVVTFGDANGQHLNQRVAAEGQLVVPDVDTEPGQFVSEVFQVDVTDGQLDLEFSDNSSNWVLTRVILRRLGDVPDPSANITVDLNATEYDYDLGTPTSPVQTGFTRVSPNTTGDVNWTGNVNSIDRTGVSGSFSDLFRDLVFSSNDATFNHRIANGTWNVRLDHGDQGSPHDNIQVFSEGSLVLADVDTAPGQFSNSFFQTTVTDGELNLQFRDNGGSDANWIVNRIRLTRQTTNWPPEVTNAINNVTVDENAANTTINLGNHFADPDNDSLTYTVSNTNNSLVNTSISGSTLTLDYQNGQSGTASITVRATDPGGEFIEDTFTVTVNADNSGSSGTGAFQESGGQVVFEAENFTNSVSALGKDWVPSSTAGSSGGALIASPNTGTNTGSNLTGARLDYDINFTETGIYRVFLRTLGVGNANNSVHVGLNGNAVTTGSGQGLGDASGNWVWVDDVSANGPQNITINVTTSGIHTFNIWMREDGTEVDKVVLNRSGTAPSGTGPAESPRDNGGGSNPPANNAPVISNTINNVTVDENAANTTENLSNNFSDPDGDSLTYSVSSNSNNTLVNTSISGSTLTLDYQNGQSGTANITVRATDPSGAFVEDTFTVTVNPDNSGGGDPPPGNIFQESGGQVVFEAENFTGSAAGTGNSSSKSWTPGPTAGSSGSSLISGPNTGTNAGANLNGPRLDYDINFTQTGTYRVFLRTRSGSTADNSVHVGLDGNAVTNSSGLGLGDAGASGNWVWADDVQNGASNITINVTTPGVHTFNIWMREDGTEIDKIVLNQSGTTPSGTGPAESPKNGNSGSPLQAASAPLASRSVTSITTDDVQTLAGAASQFWQLTGADASRLDYVEFQVTDLGGNLLGLQSGNTIYLDDDAAGYGWYVDKDATTDEAFTGMDLFTTLAHELGHILGHQDLYAEQNADELMYGFLEEGERRASLDALDEVFEAV